MLHYLPGCDVRKNHEQDAGDRALYFLWMQKLKKAGVLGQSDADRKRSVYSVRKFTETDCSLAIWK